MRLDTFLGLEFTKRLISRMSLIEVMKLDYDSIELEFMDYMSNRIDEGE